MHLQPDRNLHAAIGARLPWSGLICALALLAAICPQAARASTALPLGGMFSITPARRYLTARPPVAIAPTRVANSTQTAMSVTAIPVLLTQTPSGAFSFDRAPQALRAAQAILLASPSHFRLAPDTTRSVTLHWRSLPAHARRANLGVIYQAVPLARGQAVRVIGQLLGVDLLATPGHYTVAGKLSGLHVGQLAPGALRFALDVLNLGQAPASPTALRLIIRNARGATVLRRALAPDIVLPGAMREFAVVLPHALGAGRYTATGQMRFGRVHRSVATASFRLSGPGELPNAMVQVGPLAVHGTVGARASVSASIHNSGSASGRARVLLELYRLNGGLPANRPLARADIVTETVRPGGHARLGGSLGHLRAGTYRLLASYTTPAGQPQTVVADFQAYAPLGLLARLRGISSEHPLLGPGVFALLSVAILMVMLVRERALRRALAASRTRWEG